MHSLENWDGGLKNLVFSMCTSPDVRDWVRDAMREGLSPRQILLPLLGPQCLPVRILDSPVFMYIHVISLHYPNDCSEGGSPIF